MADLVDMRHYLLEDLMISELEGVKDENFLAVVNLQNGGHWWVKHMGAA